MQRKAEIQKAYNESVIEMQKMDILNGAHEIERCAGFQEALIWVLGNSTYRPYKIKEDDNDALENRI